MTATIENYSRQSVALSDPHARGRPAVKATPGINPSADWIDAWAGYERELRMLSRSEHTIYQRKCQVYVMARHATTAGLGPSEITKPWMQTYLLDQKAQRTGNGFCTVYENLRQFWLWFGREQKLSGQEATYTR